MTPPLWPNETPLAVIRPDHMVYWHVQGLLLCALLGLSAVVGGLFGAGGNSGGGADGAARGAGAVLAGLLTLVAPMLFNAWGELRSVWILTDRRVMLPGGGYILLSDIAAISVRWQTITLQATGRRKQVARLSFLANPAAVAARIVRARDGGGGHS